MGVTTIFHDQHEEILNELRIAKPKIYDRWILMGTGWAKKRCPVKTGRLRRSITGDKDGISAYLGTNVEYAENVENGTSRTKAKPFLRPAVTEHEDQYVKVAKDILKGG